MMPATVLRKISLHFLRKDCGPINEVMTTKAAIAQTPKELVWTLNKAKLYRYIPGCGP